MYLSRQFPTTKPLPYKAMEDLLTATLIFDLPRTRIEEVIKKSVTVQSSHSTSNEKQLLNSQMIISMEKLIHQRV